MVVQAEISAVRLQRKRRRIVRVDKAAAAGALARSCADAREIDGVRIVDGQALKPGQFVERIVEAADEHGLRARVAV